MDVTTIYTRAYRTDYLTGLGVGSSVKVTYGVAEVTFTLLKVTSRPVEVNYRKVPMAGTNARSMTGPNADVFLAQGDCPWIPLCHFSYFYRLSFAVMSPTLTI